MSSYSEYRAAFSHIMENWLQTGTLKIEHLLRAGEVVTLRHLRTYLRNPGLLQGTYVNDEGDDVGLTEEQYEELGGLSSYMSYLQNQWGPEGQVGTYDFTQKTRSDFEMFLSNHPPSEFPIIYDMEIAMASLQLHQEHEAQNDNNNNNSGSNRSEPPLSISTSSTPHVNQLLAEEKGTTPHQQLPHLIQSHRFPRLWPKVTCAGKLFEDDNWSAEETVSSDSNVYSFSLSLCTKTTGVELQLKGQKIVEAVMRELLI